MTTPAPERPRPAGSPPNSSGLDSWFRPRSRWSIWLERLALALEQPANRLIGNTHLNPFYHTGTISVFLLAIVAVTGFYIFLFYQYGFEASYTSVVERIEGPPLTRVMRAVHRYASGALVLTVLLHAFRMLFMERFNGPRWLAWLSGIAMTFILWLAGITGYWLVWDTRAQLINDSFITSLRQLTPWAPDYALRMIRADLNGTSWTIFFLILVAHVGLFLLTAFLFWLHIKRLKRVRWLPPAAWMGGAAVVLLLISAFVPAGNLPGASFTQLPGSVRLDPVYLYYLPLNDTVWANWLWAFMWTATIILGALPWLRQRGKRAQTSDLVEIIDEKCTGCTKCANDCPYGALKMVERPDDDDSPFQLLAVANPDRCVGCGICVGSCDDFYAITLGHVAPQTVWQVIEDKLRRTQAAYPEQPIKLIVTCQRHALHGAAPFLEDSMVEDHAVAVVPLTCTGAVPPHLLPRALEWGAAEVKIVGCPPFDCANREGNVWEEQRLLHERVPRVRRKYDSAPITAAWLPPDRFARALPPTPVPQPAATKGDEPAQPDYLAQRTMFEWLTWRNLLVGGVLLALLLMVQIWFTGLNFTPYPDPPSVVQLTLGDPAGWVFQGISDRPDWATGSDVPLRVEVDGDVLYETRYDPDEFYAGTVRPLAERLTLEPGRHHIRVYWEESSRNFRGFVEDAVVDLEPGQILQIHDQLPDPDVSLTLIRNQESEAARREVDRAPLPFERFAPQNDR